MGRSSNALANCHLTQSNSSAALAVGLRQQLSHPPPSMTGQNIIRRWGLARGRSDLVLFGAHPQVWYRRPREGFTPERKSRCGLVFATRSPLNFVIRALFPMFLMAFSLRALSEIIASRPDGNLCGFFIELRRKTGLPRASKNVSCDEHVTCRVNSGAAKIQLRVFNS